MTGLDWLLCVVALASFELYCQAREARAEREEYRQDAEFYRTLVRWQSSHQRKVLRLKHDLFAIKDDGPVAFRVEAESDADAVPLLIEKVR